MSTLLGVVATAPVTPDAADARRLATQELAKPIYRQGQSLLDRFIEWLRSLFDGFSLTVLDLPRELLAAIVVVVVVAVALIAFAVAGPVRLARRAASSAVVLGNDTRTADQLRAAADAHAQRGDWPAAVLDRFRAIVRSLEERALLDERPGRTAHEAAEAAAARLPASVDALRRAGQLFDDVCYGKAAVGADADARLRELDQALAGARPVAAPGRTLVGSP